MAEKKFVLPQFRVFRFNPQLDVDPRFDWESQDSQWFVDQVHKMMLEQNPDWNPTGTNGEGDAIGRSFIAFFTYGDPRFLDGIEACWEKVERRGIKRLLFGKYYYQGYRYPTHDFETGLSRDHLAYTVLAFKYAGYSDEFMKDFVRHLRWKISDFQKFTPSLWLWVRAAANIKPYTTLFLLQAWLISKLNAWWNKSLYKFTGFGEESHQDDFIKVLNDFKPSRVQKMTKLFYPIYALHFGAWKLKVLPESKLKKKVQKAMLPMCPKHNYVIKILLGYKDLVTQEEVDGYKSMTGGRWTGILNTWLNDRGLEINKNKDRLKCNVQDVDYLKKLYYTISCSDI